MATLIDRAHDQLCLARTICNTHQGQIAGIPAEVSKAEKILRDSALYARVTNLEKAAVYALGHIQADISGTHKSKLHSMNDWDTSAHLPYFEHWPSEQYGNLRVVGIRTHALMST